MLHYKKPYLSSEPSLGAKTALLSAIFVDAVTKSAANFGAESKVLKTKFYLVSNFPKAIPVLPSIFI